MTDFPPQMPVSTRIVGTGVTKRKRRSRSTAPLVFVAFVPPGFADEFRGIATVLGVQVVQVPVPRPPQPKD